MQRALVRLALLMRIVPLLQAIATIALGLSAYTRPWLGVAAAGACLAWSGWLALRMWPAGRCPAWCRAADAAVAVAALITVGAAMPPDSLTTAFYWAGSYAAAVALMLGLILPPRAGGCALAALIGGYGAMVDLRAGPHALPAAAGNAAGIAVYFGYGALAAWYARRLTTVAARAEEDALGRQALLGVQQARLEEFGRLHDEAVQVLERVTVTAAADAAPVRAYAAQAASHLRAAIDDRRTAGGSVAEALAGAAAGFAALRFGVTVDCAMPLPDPGLRATGKLAAAVTEALNNACKHSGAAHASVRAAPARGGIEVSVTDQGTGFPVGPAHDGFGIANCIRRRLTEAGGSVEIVSVPGAGTVVRMWLPC
jgi:Histidine kinase-, DNA gyrase B-, and HSP90-like ATPase